MENIIILFKNALWYCRAGWIRLKVGSFERSLLNREVRVNLLKSFMALSLFPKVTLSRDHWFLAVGSGVAGFLCFFGSFHIISSPCQVLLLNNRIAHPHPSGSVGNALTCSSSSLGSATPWRIHPLSRQLWRNGDGPQRMLMNEWMMYECFYCKRNAKRVAYGHQIFKKIAHPSCLAPPCLLLDCLNGSVPCIFIWLFGMCLSHCFERCTSFIDSVFHHGHSVILKLEA